jgi:pimeloyl-[acyl-carrier protein] methyl ester esterase
MSKLSVCHYPQKQLEIVLIHGWGLHSGVWQKLVNYLQEFASITVIDRAGYGNSPLMNAEEELAAILADCPPKAVYVGWSLGVSVILQLATQYPHRVQAMVALNATPCFVARNDWLHAMPIKTFQQFQQDTEENAYTALLRFMGLQTQGSSTQRQEMRLLQKILAEQAIPHHVQLLRGLADLAQDLSPLSASHDLPNVVGIWCKRYISQYRC